MPQDSHFSRKERQTDTPLGSICLLVHWTAPMHQQTPPANSLRSDDYGTGSQSDTMPLIRTDGIRMEQIIVTGAWGT